MYQLGGYGSVGPTAVALLSFHFDGLATASVEFFAKVGEETECLRRQRVLAPIFDDRLLASYRRRDSSSSPDQPRQS